MDMHSRVGPEIQVSPETQANSLVAALMDWLANVAVTRPVSVAIAAAVEEYERSVHAPRIVARLRRGIDRSRVQQVFAECHSAMNTNEVSNNAASAQYGHCSLICEWQPVRIHVGAVYCSLDTSDEQEYRFAFTAAIRKARENSVELGHRLLLERVAEIAAAHADARDDLEELLWCHQN